MNTTATRLTHFVMIAAVLAACFIVKQAGAVTAVDEPCATTTALVAMR